MRNSYDCLVIGGGPAGATAAARAAQAGFRTLLVEREGRPRVGPAESLTPQASARLAGLGAVAACRKSSFFREDLVRHLRKAAERQGVRLLSDCQAAKVLFAGEQAVGVRVELPSGELAEFLGSHVIDASGQQALLATQLGLRQPQSDGRQAIIWGIYEGVPRPVDIQAALRFPVEKNRAWFRVVYLGGNRVCVSLVGDSEYLLSGRGAPEEIFEDELVLCPALARQLMTARLVDRFLVGCHEPFTVHRAMGDGWRIIGDARQPADPLSSGALSSAILAAYDAADSLASPAQGFIPACRLKVPAFRTPC